MEKDEEEKRRNDIFVRFPRKKRSIVIYIDAEYSPAEDPQEEEEEEEERRNNIFVRFPRKKRFFVIAPPTMKTRSPEWLLGVMRDMNIFDGPIHIIDKTLDLDDIDPKLNRLSMPFNNLIRNDFLNSDESRIIEDNNNGRMSVAAILVDQRSQKWFVDLKSTSSGSYELSGEWSDVVEANGMKNGDNISFWSFRSRVSGYLYFALVPPPSSALDSR